MFLEYIKKNFLILSIIFLFVFIAGSVIYINFLGSKSASQSKISNAEFNNLKTQAIALSNDKQIASDTNYSKLIRNLNEFDNKSLTKDEQLSLLKKIIDNAFNSYARTNDHRLYEFQKTLANYINKYFPEIGRIEDPQCMDPSCAQNSTPKEILAIIEEIKASTVPQELKNEINHELITFSYIHNDDAYTKAYDFIFVAEDIKTNKEFVDSGNSERWSGEIINYVKKTFPNEYNQIQQKR